MTKLPTSVYKIFYYFIRKKPIVFLIFFLTPVTIILEANIIPYSLKMFVDIISKYQPGSDTRSSVMKELYPVLWLGGSAWLGVNIITRLQHFWSSYVIPGFEADIRMSILKHVMNHSYNYFSSKLTGNTASKIEDLPNSIESIRQILCWNVISTFAVVLVSLIIMLTINPVFSLILGSWTFFHLAISTYFAKIINRVSKDNAEDKSELHGVITDTILNIITVKLFAADLHDLIHIKKLQDKEKDSNSILIRSMAIFQVCMDIPIALMLGVTTYFLIVSWCKGIISTGDFIFVFNVTMALIYQLMSLGHLLTNLFREIGKAQQALTLITSLYDVTDVPGSKSLVVSKGEIVFKDVSFSYNKYNYVFKNKNLIIKSGQKVGIVGYSGSGKSTFINLILRFFDVDSGKIFIDGQDISKVTQNSLRKNIAIVPQDTSLFYRTLIENIRYGCHEASDEEVIAASKDAHCHEFIMKLPDGYNTIVGGRGIKLSMGQRQRIAIARAILKNSPILILDEATSALDSVTEQYIQNALHILMKNRTTIVIAHRLSTLIEMDRIIVFDHGKIVEDGTHVELLNANGCYSYMWQMQANGFLYVDLEPHFQKN
jgi:ATP-binding cassette subfamily B protein